MIRAMVHFLMCPPAAPARWRLRRRLTMAAALAVAAALPAVGSQGPSTASELFDAGKVWNIHLTFTAEQWKAMEPVGGAAAGGRGGFGFPGGPGGPGEAGGRGGRGGRGGFGEFSPGAMLAPVFLEGAKNAAGPISREEFRALGEKWFGAWDKSGQGKLTQDQIRAGLETTLVPGGGRGGPMGFGGPDGEAGRGPGGQGGRGPGIGMLGGDGRNGLAAMMGIEFPYVHAGIDFNGSTFSDVGVRYKGNSTYMQSSGSLKRSMKLEFNRYEKGRKMAGVTKFNLHSNVTDAAWMNEPLSYRLFRDGAVPAGRTSYARVYLTVAGKYDHQYVGLYSIVEEVDNNFTQERFSTREGAIFKPSTQSLFTYLGDDWSKYEQSYDPKTALTEAQKARVIAFAKLLSKGTDAEFAAQVAGYLDLDEVARYLAINTWLANMDSILSMGQNYYLYLNPGTGKFSMLPWDLDLSFGGMGGSSELSIEHPWNGQNRFLERLFKLEAFHKLYVTHMAEFNGSIFKPERITALVDETAKAIRAAVGEESAAKLAAFDDSVAGKAAAGRGGFGGFGGRGGGGGGFGPGFGGPDGGPGGLGPGGPGGPGGTSIKAFAGTRARSVAAQLAGTSSGQQGGAGFGGRGGPGGGPGMGGPGGGPDFAATMAASVVKAMDSSHDGAVTRAEFLAGFQKWFDSWSGGKATLSLEQLGTGITRDLMPQFAMPPGR